MLVGWRSSLEPSPCGVKLVHSILAYRRSSCMARRFLVRRWISVALVLRIEGVPWPGRQFADQPALAAEETADPCPPAAGRPRLRGSSQWLGGSAVGSPCGCRASELPGRLFLYWKQSNSKTSLLKTRENPHTTSHRRAPQRSSGKGSGSGHPLTECFFVWFVTFSGERP